MCMCVLAVPSINISASESNIIENNEDGIPDRVLYLEILNALGKNHSEKLTKQEAQSIKELEINESNLGKVKTLKGIGYLNQLEDLHIEGHSLKSLKGVEDLHNLISLDVPNNQIKTLKPLENLTNLQYLIVIGNRLTSLEGIENLQNLELLYAAYNKLTSLKAIKGLINLKTLTVYDNELKTLKGIKRLTNLVDLDVGENKLTNLPEIKRLKNLEKLGISYNKIKKLPDLKKFKKLDCRTCDFSNNFISEKEIRKKLPARFFKKKNQDWVNDQIRFQNLQYKIKFIEPENKKQISKNTKRIEGYAFKGAYVELCNLKKGKYSKRIQTDENGYFVLENLKLRKWAGNRAAINIYMYSDVHDDLLLVKSNNQFKISK